MKLLKELIVVGLVALVVSLYMAGSPLVPSLDTIASFVGKAVGTVSYVADTINQAYDVTQHPKVEP
jgi:hypothetical protein